MPDWRQDEALARGVFREVNERIRELGEACVVGGYRSMLCECGNVTCIHPIRVSPAEYEEVRGRPRRFAIAVDHENPEVETIVWQNGSFAVVEVFAGETSRFADTTRQPSTVGAT